MTCSTLPGFRAFPIALALAAGIGGFAATASAQSAPAPAAAEPASPVAADADPMRLTDEQRDAILNANTEDRAAAARGEMTESERLGRGIHGEMGVMIGTNGTRGIYGTADIPLGDNAGATISFESSRFGYPRPRSRPE